MCGPRCPMRGPLAGLVGAPVGAPEGVHGQSAWSLPGNWGGYSLRARPAAPSHPPALHAGRAADVKPGPLCCPFPCAAPFTAPSLAHLPAPSYPPALHAAKAPRVKPPLAGPLCCPFPCASPFAAPSLAHLPDPSHPPALHAAKAPRVKPPLAGPLCCPFPPSLALPLALSFPLRICLLPLPVYPALHADCMPADNGAKAHLPAALAHPCTPHPAPTPPRAQPAATSRPRAAC